MSSGDDEQAGLSLEWKRGLPIVLFVLILLAVAALAVISGDGRVARRPPDGAAIGFAAPDFSLATPDGERVALADLSGVPVVLHFFASWCVTCDDDVTTLAGLTADTPDETLRIVGIIHDDDPEDALRYATDRGATWPALVDPDGSVWAAYSAVGPPSSFLIDAAGILRVVVPGPLDPASLDGHLASIGIAPTSATGPRGSSQTPAAGGRRP